MAIQIYGPDGELTRPADIARKAAFILGIFSWLFLFVTAPLSLITPMMICGMSEMGCSKMPWAVGMIILISPALFFFAGMAGVVSLRNPSIGLLLLTFVSFAVAGPLWIVLLGVLIAG